MSDPIDELRARRVEKLAQLRALGRDPYGNAVRPTHEAAAIHAAWGAIDGPGLESPRVAVSVAGRVVFSRAFGKAGFLKLLDASGQIQVYCQQQQLPADDFAVYQLVDVGDLVHVDGYLFRTKTGELSVHAEHVAIATKSLRPLPEKWHGLSDVETRYRQRYVDLIANPEVRAVFRRRSLAITALREFAVARGFLEVETPMMHPIPGGATARPFATHHNALDIDLYLRVAPELYLKRLVVGGFERVFEINRNFRNEGVSTQHNPEFTMMEWYQAYATYEDQMRFIEEAIADVAQRTTGATTVSYQGTALNLAGPYRRLRMADAVMELGGAPAAAATDQDSALQFAATKGIVLKTARDGHGAILTELFEILVQPQLIQPTFITHYPVEVSPLARRSAEAPALTDRFELFVFGREIANGFSELNDPLDQAERFREQAAAKARGDNEAMFYDADFVRALEYGMPPTAGAGLGVDRLVMFLTDAASIRDVILFPLLRPESPPEAPCPTS